MNAQIVLWPNGDFATTSNEVETVCRRVNPDDWDDDGIPNDSDLNPLVSDGDFFGPANILPVQFHTFPESVATSVGLVRIDTNELYHYDNIIDPAGKIYACPVYSVTPNLAVVCGEAEYIPAMEIVDYKQIFMISEDGTASVEKHGHTLSRSRYCHIWLDGKTLQRVH